MKKVIATAGMFAVGMVGSRAQNVTGLSQEEASKWWSVSASLRGFYDDNSTAANQDQQESFGFQFAPAFSLNMPLERTRLSADYRLTLDYYEAREGDATDTQHEFEAEVNHKFTPRHSLNLKDTFLYSNQPQIGEVETLRNDITYYRNVAAIDFDTRLAPVLGAALGYRNVWVNYEDEGVGSLSSLLDRTEHEVSLEGQWLPAENTTGYLGYQIGLVSYASEEPIGIDNLGQPVFAEDRNVLSHYFYVGAGREFNPQLLGAARLGVQYAQYYNVDDSDLSPYVDLKVVYTYLPKSTAGAGFNVSRGPVDVGLTESGLTKDAIVTTAYVSVDHRITPRLRGSFLGNYQNSIYNGGDLDGESDDYFTVSLSVDYQIRENLYANLAYEWYRYLTVRPASSYTRNRVFAGIRVVF